MLIRQLPRRSFLLVMVASIGSGACSLTPQLEDSAVALPDQYREASERAASSQFEWWHEFNSPNLNQAIDTVLARNLDIEVAVARVQELQHRFRITRAAQLPSVNAGARREQQDLPSNTGIGGQLGERIRVPGGGVFPERFEFTTYSASLGLGFELDFWGRARANSRAAVSEYLASQSDFRTVILGVIAETIATWLELTERQQAKELLEQDNALLAMRVDIAADRHGRGLMDSAELRSLQQMLAVGEAEVPIIDSHIEVAMGRLAVLMGQAEAAPMEMEPWTVEDLPDIPSGLPSDLLQERPDVVAAYERLVAAGERIGAARAARFPSFALTGSAGTQSSLLSDIVQTGQNFFTLGADLAAPLFNGSAGKANVEAARSRYRQHMAEYEKVVLTAFTDVETALINLTNQKERHRSLQDAAANAVENAVRGEYRYETGIGDVDLLLEARRNVIRIRMIVAASERAVAEARLSVHRSLGGAWTSRQES